MSSATTVHASGFDGGSAKPTHFNHFLLPGTGPDRPPMGRDPILRSPQPTLVRAAMPTVLVAVASPRARDCSRLKALVATRRGSGCATPRTPWPHRLPYSLLRLARDSARQPNVRSVTGPQCHSNDHLQVGLLSVGWSSYVSDEVKLCQWSRRASDLAARALLVVGTRTTSRVGWVRRTAETCCSGARSVASH